VLDATRAKTRLGWTAATPHDEGLQRTVAWFRTEVGA
jgi:nucleoside-diphosphate-sugar epimerase